MRVKYRYLSFRRPTRTAPFRVTQEVMREALGGRGGAMGDAFFTQDGAIVDKWGQYLPAYERHFGPYVDSRVRFLEIGVSQGGSLDMWRRYFGPDATIFGVDIDPRAAVADRPEHPVRIGSQDDSDFLESVVREMGGIDVVLDDGSHRAQHQRASFEALFPLLSDGGLYVVEDTHTSYWRREYRGGFRRKGTFIEVAKDLVDGMHAWYYRRSPPRLGRLAKTEVESVCFYDSMVVIFKRRHGRPMTTRVGKPAW